ncbi:hypothetical protein FOZ63_004698 [Perkinsus olseni]|uniref:Uncharacterized protein n=1 Tax=Perkinsus olseni TaxID=32597 RepID=A0A7J6S6D9_PEROL|nr:hypothetical protein FOZ60_015069 [Perkinsus olseni]KAF4728519.1 hypothetical protein FOZ62_001482 [Perkinsus olseni]KAF4736155.1 hypothetical protein FOZ63_004698 [Perkinsus olseni]
MTPIEIVKAIHRLLKSMEVEGKVVRLPIQEAWTINEIVLVAKKGDASWKKLPTILDEGDQEAVGANFRVTLDLRYVNANVGVTHGVTDGRTSSYDDVQQSQYGVQVLVGSLPASHGQWFGDVPYQAPNEAVQILVP